jgi:hypothetical protein
MPLLEEWLQTMLAIDVGRPVLQTLLPLELLIKMGM